MKKYIFMTVMSMIVAGTAFAQTTGSVTALHCDKAYFLKSMWTNGDSVIHKGEHEFSIWAIPYEGGNGGILADSEIQNVESYDVEGLELSPMLYPLGFGDGYIEVVIEGTPSSSGTAKFNVTYGGKSCVVQVLVHP